MANAQLINASQGDEADDESDDLKCPCCKGPAHANQKVKGANGKFTMAPTVSEAEWYGPEDHKTVQEARAKGCKNVPEKPDDGECGTYFVQTDSKQRQKARHNWMHNHKKDYVDRWNRTNPDKWVIGGSGRAAGSDKGVYFVKSPTSLGPPPKAEPPKGEGDKIDHKVPIAAGGCLKNDKNLHPSKHQSDECQKLGEKLDKQVHSRRTEHWDKQAKS
jgi:hypothetical protein